MTETLETQAFKRDCQRLARRKSRKSWFEGLTPCGTLSKWRGMIYGNAWTYTAQEVKALLRNGARKPV
jgi:hypothetical protein